LGKLVKSHFQEGVRASTHPGGTRVSAAPISILKSEWTSRTQYRDFSTFVENLYPISTGLNAGNMETQLISNTYLAILFGFLIAKIKYGVLFEKWGL
jgi:hypothetical protein